VTGGSPSFHINMFFGIRHLINLSALEESDNEEPDNVLTIIDEEILARKRFES
jgi:hypothetical protein